eukprot:1767592-Amphidinium_carterae.1
MTASSSSSLLPPPGRHTPEPSFPSREALSSSVSAAWTPAARSTLLSASSTLPLSSSSARIALTMRALHSAMWLADPPPVLAA